MDVLGVVEGVGWIRFVGTGRSPSELLIVLKMWDDPQPCTNNIIEQVHRFWGGGVAMCIHTCVHSYRSVPK